MPSFKVRVVKDNLVFCSGHFATFNGEAEPLHGHNYRAANNPLLDIRPDATSFTVRTGHKTYVFPREDVVQLPILNTTAEQLAEWIVGELETALRAKGAANITAIEIEVEEVFGQSAFCRKEINPQISQMDADLPS
ncbi:MAG TPA: hypothetical protein VJL59_20130 [Anaerolineales bacterium]|nr:hypothetical protein [Anaerolineales bacterium]